MTTVEETQVAAPTEAPVVDTTQVKRKAEETLDKEVPVKAVKTSEEPQAAPAAEPEEAKKEDSEKEEVPESPEKEEADGEVELEGDMDHLDQSNIITTGRRTRGKKIDFKAILEQEGDEDEEDEEDDGDVAPAADDAEEEEEEAADDEE